MALAATSPVALCEDSAFESLHPRAGTGQFAKKDQAAKKAKAKRPSLANIKGKEMAWAQRIRVEAALRDTTYVDGYDEVTGEFAKLTGIRTEAGLRKFAFTQSRNRLQAIFGANAQIEHAENPDVQRVVGDLALVPTPMLVALRDAGVRIAIGARPISTYSEYVWGEGQRSWDGRALADVPAAYIPESRLAVVDARTATPDTMLHELGHAVDLAAAGISRDPEFLAIQAAEAGRLGNAYFLDPSHPEESAREFAAESLNRFWRRVPVGPRTDAYLARRGLGVRAKSRRRVT